MSNGPLVCTKILYDNQYNYRYVIKSYNNGYKIVQVIFPYRGAWYNGARLEGFNISFKV